MQLITVLSFFLQVVLSGFVFAGLVVASGSLAAFMGRGELESLIQVLSLSIVVVAFYNVLKNSVVAAASFSDGRNSRNVVVFLGWCYCRHYGLQRVWLLGVGSAISLC